MMGRVGPKQKNKIPQAKIKGKNIRAASCDIKKKVDKPQKNFLHRQLTGKKSSNSGKSYPSHHFSNGPSLIVIAPFYYSGQQTHCLEISGNKNNTTCRLKLPKN